MRGEKWYIADIDNTLEIFGYKEEHKTMMACREDVELSERIFFFDRKY